MTTVMPERALAQLPVHPTACPSWCKDCGEPLAHAFGPTMTPHWSQQYTLMTPLGSDSTEPVMLRAELSRLDEADATDEARLYIQGETDVALTIDEADVFIAQAQAFVDTLRVLRRQMGGVR